MLYELGMHTVPTAPKGLHLPVLVPNMKGLDKLVYIDDRCSQAGGGRVTDEIAVFVSATEVSGMHEHEHEHSTCSGRHPVHYSCHATSQSNGPSTEPG
jgi:hydroxymethylglutaryl-CoA lyase